MERFCTTFSASRIAYLLADREFVGTHWWGYLKQRAIGFRSRIKTNLAVSTNQGQRPVGRLFSNLSVGQRRVLRTPRQVSGVRLYLAAERLSSSEWLIVASSDAPHHSLAQYAQRWSIEVTFEEVRRHLGVETQRQWSKQAIARTTPILLALFSLVTVLADRLIADGAMPVRTSAWYRKTRPTFSDALALVRRQLWAGELFSMSRSDGDIDKMMDPVVERLSEALCYAA